MSLPGPKLRVREVPGPPGGSWEESVLCFFQRFEVASFFGSWLPAPPTSDSVHTSPSSLTDSLPPSYKDRYDYQTHPDNPG